jgi:hypothetical protein
MDAKKELAEDEDKANTGVIVTLNPVFTAGVAENLAACASTLAHELGHYLGLNACHDKKKHPNSEPIDSECAALSPEEQQTNVMSWSNYDTAVWIDFQVVRMKKHCVLHAGEEPALDEPAGV